MDYKNYSDPRKYEVIDGIIYYISPMPNRHHAIVNGNIFSHLKGYFKDNRCEIFIEQLDFYYHYSENKKDYIIPDIAIVCDWAKDEKDYHGVPRFVVETLSPSTGHRDKTTKKEIYRNCGVEEYWLVDPSGSIEIYYLIDGKYELVQSYIYDDDDENDSYNAEIEIKLRNFPHIGIKMSDIFAF